MSAVLGLGHRMDSTCPQQAGHSLRSLQNDNEQKQFAPPINCSLLIANCYAGLGDPPRLQAPDYPQIARIQNETAARLQIADFFLSGAAKDTAVE